MSENKSEIVQKLKELLQITRAGSGIRDLILDEWERCVAIEYECGSKQVDITGDSGIALIRDVVKRV